MVEFSSSIQSSQSEEEESVFITVHVAAMSVGYALIMSKEFVNSSSPEFNLTWELSLYIIV